MHTSINEAAIRKQEGLYAHAVSLLPDLTDDEQKAIVEICVAHFKNNEGLIMAPQGIVNLAHRVRSRRVERKDAADRHFETIKRQSADWVKAHFPEVN